jgi:threonine/homoserine/homoserine lactone efflux protein
MGALAPSLLVSAALAGAIVVLTPGPAVLAFLGIGAAQGRLAGASFLAGHLAGDLVWTTLALVALVGARLVSPWVFHGLAIFCGLYLFWLGFKALTARRTVAGGVDLAVHRPLGRGLVFGLSNPKSYPVTLSVFTALLAGDLDALTVGNAPLFLGACLAGFLAADAILIWLVGMSAVRRIYRRHQLWIARATGVLFIGFAVNTLVHAWQDIYSLRSPPSISA